MPSPQFTGVIGHTYPERFGHLDSALLLPRRSQGSRVSRACWHTEVWEETPLCCNAWCFAVLIAGFFQVFPSRPSREPNCEFLQIAAFGTCLLGGRSFFGTTPGKVIWTALNRSTTNRYLDSNSLRSERPSAWCDMSGRIMNNWPSAEMNSGAIVCEDGEDVFKNQIP